MKGHHATKLINDHVFQTIEARILRRLVALRENVQYWGPKEIPSSLGLNLNFAVPAALVEMSARLLDVRTQVHFLAEMRIASQRGDQELGRVALLYHFGAQDPDMNIVLEPYPPDEVVGRKNASVRLVAGGSPLSLALYADDPLDQPDYERHLTDCVAERRWTELFLELLPPPHVPRPQAVA